MCCGGRVVCRSAQCHSLTQLFEKEHHLLGNNALDNSTVEIPRKYYSSSMTTSRPFDYSMVSVCGNRDNANLPEVGLSERDEEEEPCDSEPACVRGEQGTLRSVVRVSTLTYECGHQKIAHVHILRWVALTMSKKF